MRGLAVAILKLLLAVEVGWALRDIVEPGVPMLAVLVACSAASGKVRRAVHLGFWAGLLQDGLSCTPPGSFASLYAGGAWLLAQLAADWQAMRGLLQVGFLAALLGGELGMHGMLTGVFPGWRWEPFLWGMLGIPLVRGWDLFLKTEA